MLSRLLLVIFCVLSLCSFSAAAEDSYSIDNLLSSELVFQHTPAAANSLTAVAVRFELAPGQHFYADQQSAPSGKSLKISASADTLIFAQPVSPPGHDYFDKVTQKNLRVFSDKFTIYIPFKTSQPGNVDVEIAIEGLTCTEQLCRPVSYKLTKTLNVVAAAPGKPAFEIPAQEPDVVVPSQKSSLAIALSLAVVAGLLLNVMPCVWPVLPIIIMRILSQADKKRSRSIALGLAFSLGILLFFAALAVLNIILKLSFGIVLQWGDQFRNQSFVYAMALLMVVLAMFMFGVFSFGLPALSSGGASRKGFAGSIGMGFLAAVLSTPCSFAILTFVLAWAQTQPLLPATVVIMTIGLGMSLPYLLLTAIPSLLAKIPKPGRWMEMFKQATGFLLLAIGVKLIEAVPGEKLIGLLYYAIVLAVCIWIWGTQVSYDSGRVKKWSVRLFALSLAVIAGYYFLSAPKPDLIDWQKYDAQKIADAKSGSRPVLIKFTADWCMSCKVLDKTVYSNASIAELIRDKNVLAIKADTTEFNYPAAIAMREVYKEPAVPVTILLFGKGQPVRLRGNFIKTELTKQLNNLPQEISQ